MADLDISEFHGIIDKRRGRGVTGAASIYAEYDNMDNVAALKARLTTLNATSYTAARLATMTRNDMVYALRLASADTAGI